MAFQVSAFIKIENDTQREDVVRFLEDVGYIIDPNKNRLKYADIIYTTRLGAYFAYSDMEDDYDGFVDCGTSTELFRALCALNDENDYKQLFKSDIVKLILYLCEDKQIKVPLHSKLTKDEIIARFTNK